MLDWCRENVYTADGNPYDHSFYPHIGAPGGPMDAFDYPQYLTIWLQWASQIGKTFFGQCAVMKTAACDPCPMLFSSADQKLSVEVTDRTYRMLDRCKPLREQLRPPHRRKQNLVDLMDCRMFIAWARSVSTLADKSVQVGHANEIDKWEHQKTSKEADPLELFADRFKKYQSRHKRICESTPARKSTSRVERGRLASTNCQFYVPCPHCGRYQTLVKGGEHDAFGIKWERNSAGKSDKDMARKTARYVCRHCAKDILDQHRGSMMRAGVWVPEGCQPIDDKARQAAERSRQFDAQPFRGWKLADWIEGEPARDGRDYGCQLSSIYSLNCSWGDIASKFIETNGRPHELRNFINQWLGETWEAATRQATWEQIGEKLIDRSLPRFVCPSWSSLLTLAIDRQSAGGDRFPWILTAWGPERRCAVIAYGEVESLAEIETHLFGRDYEHADSGERLKIAATLIDSGHRPQGVYEFCRDCFSKKQLQVWPCKGSNRSLDSEYKKGTLGPNTSMPGMLLFEVDTIRSQLWLDNALHSLAPTDPGGVCVHQGSLSEHQDFLEQILNDAAVQELDARNNSTESWERINENVPNDFRDAWRYAYVAMILATRNAPIPARVSMSIPQRRSAVISSGFSHKARW